MVAPMSTRATTPSCGIGRSVAIRAKAFSTAKASTSITRAVRPPSSNADWRSSTFSERDAARSTCTISGLLGMAPSTSKSMFTSSMGYGM